MRLFKSQQTEYWEKLKLPAANSETPFDEDGNPIDCLFPEKWAQIDWHNPVKEFNHDTGQDELKYKSLLWWKQKQLALAFGPEFMMNPIDDSTRYFRRGDFGDYVVPGPAITAGHFHIYFQQYQKLLEYLPNDLIVVTAIDPAGTDEKQTEQAAHDPDYTVIMTMGYSPTTLKYYMVGVDRLRCTPGVMIEKLVLHYTMFNRMFGGRYVPNPDEPNKYLAGFPFHHMGIVIETVAFQRVLAGMLEETAHALGMYPLIIEVNRGGSRGKRMRAMLPSMLSQNGLLMMPYQIPGLADPRVIEVIDEICDFPGGAHDDTVDALSDATMVLHELSVQVGGGRGLMSPEALRSLFSGSYEPSVQDLEETLRQALGRRGAHFRNTVPPARAAG